MDNTSMNPKLALLFVKVAMVYLVVGSIMLFASLASIVPLGKEPIFIMELYGFVTMMIFGLSYIFVPGLSHSGFANYKSIEVEFVSMNIGVILLAISMLRLIPGYASRIAMPIALAALTIGILIHAANMFRMVSKKNVIVRTPDGKTSRL